MKKKEEKKDSKMPQITIVKSLDKYKGKIIFKNTFAKAQETLKNIKLPDSLTKGKELNKSKVPIVKIDNSSDTYKDQVLFKEKVEKANETLKNVGLPKSLPKKARLS